MSIAHDNTVLDRMLEPIVDCLTPEVAQRIADMRVVPYLQSRLDELAAKANEGELSVDEQREYHDYIEALDLIGILQAKARLRVTRAISP